MFEAMIYEMEICQQGVRFALSTSVPKGLGYKRGSDITDNDITEVRLYI